VTILAVLRETGVREKRVSVVPAEVPRLLSTGVQVVVESGAGSSPGFADAEFSGAGASVARSRAEALSGASMIVMVGPPSVAEVEVFPDGAALLSLLPPAWCLEVIEVLRVRRVDAFSFNLVPRTSRAQAVDALSSQAGVAGYRAVILAADRIQRILPMMMTAAGTLAPVKVLVIGAGVAGLQAIATARRLGAAVSGYDVRPEASEEIRSLGATAVELPLVAESGSGGYAAEQSAEFTARQQEMLTSAVGGSDIVITTAAVPGRPAPQIVTSAMVEAMKPGSVIVDLAAQSGGNCELTVDGTEVEHQGVTIIGAGDMASEAAASASALYARNVSNLVKLVVRDGEYQPDFGDDILDATCITSGGVIRHEPTRSMIEGART
jgi:H+-translocating NAD(P) transhydrogenase subunit alpha